MSKFIRALALFSLTIGLAGCLHSDDDTVFTTVPGPIVTVNVPVVDTGGIIDDAGNPANTELAEERPSEVENPAMVTTMVEAMLATMRETMFTTMLATRRAALDSDDDGTPDATDTDDNNDGTLDTDDPNFPDANDNSIDDTAETALETEVRAEVETALANLRPGIEANIEADLAPSIAEASTDNPVFSFSSLRSPTPTPTSVGTRTSTNIVYGPRADLGLVEFNSDGTPPDRRVIPQIAAYEVINARVDNRRYAYYDREDIPFEEVDTDGDGTPDFQQVNSDDDITPDFMDDDDNNDGTLDVNELAADFPDANSNGVNDLVEAGIADFNDVAYFVEQGAMMKFAALAYWIDSPSDALDFSTVQPLSEIGAGVFGLETAAANLPRGRAEYRGSINGFYRKRTPTEINTGLFIRPDLPVNRDTTLVNDVVYPIVLSTGAQNYLVEGPVNVTAEFVLGEVNGGFTATAYEPNYRLDYNPESPADYDPDAERNDETFSQYLRGGDYHVPNRGGLRLAPAGIIAIPTIDMPRLDSSNRPVLDGNGFPIVDRSDAVVLPAITALTTTMDNLGNPVLDVNGDPLMVPVRAVTDGNGVPIEVPVGQSRPAIIYSPLSGTTETAADGTTVWVPDDDAALAIRRSLANTLPDPFTRSRPQVPVIPSILQGQFEGRIINGRFAGPTGIGVSETPTGRTVARDVTEVLFVTRAQIDADVMGPNPPLTYTYGFVEPPSTELVPPPRTPRTSTNPVPLVRRIIRQRDNNGNVIPGGTIREEAVTDGDDNPLFIVSRTTSTQVPETAAIEPTGVFAPLSGGAGTILGQFFGPNGEETAGSGNLADTDGNELVFTFGGRQIGLIPPLDAPDVIDLQSEDAARIAERTRLNTIYDELVNRILTDEVFDDPANRVEITPESEVERLNQYLDAKGIPEDARPNPEFFNRIVPAGGRNLFRPITVPAGDIDALGELSRMFRLNPGIVDNPAMLRDIHPDLAP